MDRLSQTPASRTVSGGHKATHHLAAWLGLQVDQGLQSWTWLQGLWLFWPVPPRATPPPEVSGSGSRGGEGNGVGLWIIRRIQRGEQTGGRKTSDWGFLLGRRGYTLWTPGSGGGQVPVGTHPTLGVQWWPGCSERPAVGSGWETGWRAELRPVTRKVGRRAPAGGAGLAGACSASGPEAPPSASSTWSPGCSCKLVPQRVRAFGAVRSYWHLMSV